MDVKSVIFIWYLFTINQSIRQVNLFNNNNCILNVKTGQKSQ